MQKEKIRKIAYSCFFIAVFISTSGGFFVPQNIAEAKKSSVTKWQTKLVKAGIDQALWQKYMPKISRGECNKVMKVWKKMGGTSQTTGATAQTPVVAQTNLLGPEIAVGLRYFEKSGSIKIDANKTYRVSGKDSNGASFSFQVAADVSTRVEYYDDGHLRVYGDSVVSTIVDNDDNDNYDNDVDKITFDAVDGDNTTIIFNTNDGNYDHYRGKIEVNYYDGCYKGKCDYGDIYGGSSSKVKQIWVVNKLPLEQYVHGMGETTGTGDSDHVRVMATIFRTYGDWYIENANKYKPLGFMIRSDSGSQIYGGYDWEKDHPNIKSAAEDTRGKIVKYYDKDDNKWEVALTPYCSYTNGKTRKMNGYSYLKSVKDHKKGTIKGMKPGDNGNHMWGLSAHGALGFAEDGKAWDWILKYYYTGVNIDNL